MMKRMQRILRRASVGPNAVRKVTRRLVRRGWLRFVGGGVGFGPRDTWREAGRLRVVLPFGEPGQQHSGGQAVACVRRVAQTVLAGGRMELPAPSCGGMDLMKEKETAIIV